MIWPLDAIAHLRGPDFLVLYAVVIAITLVACRRVLRPRDTTVDLAPAAIPGRPDPVEIAYLRGGANEVVRLLVVCLLDRGHLMVVDGDPKRVARTPSSNEDNALTPTDGRLLASFTAPRTVREVFGEGSLLGQVEADCAQHRERLQVEQLLTSPSATRAAWRATLLGAAVIVGLGGYKLLAATQATRPNVLFLVMVGAFALMLLWKTCRPHRLTARGREYVRRLGEAYGSPEQRSPEPDGGVAARIPLLVGLYGVGVLAETSSHRYAALFPKASKNDGFELSADGCAACGSSCGSSCGGCGGCGD
ncbi:MAG: TIGR04222 domain-containing membrane protein [Chloroflexota bacterium]|nr:TIGR04222 domain-containing membrane protein [Chloroflexota bacterium]